MRWGDDASSNVHIWIHFTPSLCHVRREYKIDVLVGQSENSKYQAQACSERWVASLTKIPELKHVRTCYSYHLKELVDIIRWQDK